MQRLHTYIDISQRVHPCPISLYLSIRHGSLNNDGPGTRFPWIAAIYRWLFLAGRMLHHGSNAVSAMHR